ncbi:BNR repeat-containing protein [Wenxinia marina]|uniref:BNR repeat-containing family member n=1 Tax=Wenxinia marina DSM 24838 TaxID=1123501 RepID=A0A0D0QAC6_9RHOB|nr:BNR repeat-containing protein [Wenxinia marina]KIQ71424.1 hypothetical protein Wenmar_04070 [Wenxinia marina DSM 24838]GGL78895.1 hypothetical protein GCM10011392_36720 [Wenxinia marina]
MIHVCLRRARALLVLAGLLFAAAAPVAAQDDPLRIGGYEVAALDLVWAGHDVGFEILEGGTRVYVAYYDATRQLTLASARIGAQDWDFCKLDSMVGWDSHNQIALGLDAAGNLHVAANMHGSDLSYWRTTEPGDVCSAEPLAVLTDAAAEQAMSYPRFLRDAAGELIYAYRDGTSGRGDQIYLAYDTRRERFTRISDAPLIDGEGLYNAYLRGPVQGPDGWFHIAFVWRDTPDARTNHDLGYARSRDLRDWETSRGRPLPLPITYGTAEIVDPVPVEAGMINNNTPVGFDPDGRPVIAYHKFDAAGDTQVFLARDTGTGWEIVQATRWRDFRWEFGGTGTLDFRLVLDAPRSEGDWLIVPIRRDGRSLELVVDPYDLRVVEEREVRTFADRVAPYIDREEGLRIRTTTETFSGDPDPYRLIWTTLPSNRDAPRFDIPDPTVLRVLTPLSRVE